MKAYRLHLKFLLPLLLLLLLQSGGLWLGIKSLQIIHVVQQEIRTKSNPTNVVRFTLSHKDYEHYAIDKGKELNIEGRLFDVVSTKMKCDSVEVTALEDAFEKRLIALLINTSKSSSNKDSGDAYLLALMHLQFILPMKKEFKFISLIQKKNSAFREVIMAWKSNWQLDLEQPPDNKRNIL